MSLVGNLEDLSLGDILQIISLSQKSGVLALASDHGSGRIVFRSGTVQAACLKGRPNDLRDLLVSREVIDGARFDAALARARDRGVTIEEILATEAGLGPDLLDSLVQEATEAAILEMFSWPTGEFSFDVRGELEADDPHLILASGLNAQYLAMEGLRLRDERAREEQGDDDSQREDPLWTDDGEWTDDRDPQSDVGLDENERTQPLGDEASAAPPADPIFGDDPLEVDPPALETGELAETTLPEDLLDRDLLDDTGADAPDLAETTAELQANPLEPVLPPARDVAPKPAADPVGATHELVASVVETANPVQAGAEASMKTPAPAPTTAPAPMTARLEKTEAPAPSPPSGARMQTPVILIEPDVSALEWVKSAINGDFTRVHTFQQADPGLARIRQYLIRSELPVVLLSPETPIDPLSGIHGLADFVRRLKTQAPRIVVLGLVEAGEAPALPAGFDGMLERPTRREIGECPASEAGPLRERFSVTLGGLLGQRSSTGASGSESSPADEKQDTESLKGLRNATAQLQQASSRGEVLPVVLDFAATVFSRAAILMVREGSAFAIAGRGIAALEVDPLDSPPAITLDLGESGWLRRAVDTAQPLVAAPATPADRALLEAFGGVAPSEVYLGPIESGDAVIALLYGDHGEGGRPIPDTSGLEVVLHHAGLALDRAALERALWEVETEGEAG